MSYPKPGEESFYEEVYNEETQISAGNKIIELDPKDVRFEPGTDKYEKSVVFPEDLGFLCEMLNMIGASGQSAQLEIERRHMVDNEDHTIRFTAKELTSIAVSLSFAFTVNFYRAHHDANDIIKKFGYLIKRQETAPLDGDFRHYEAEGIAQQTGTPSHFDPFKTITGTQLLAFLDEDGEPIQPGDFDPADIDVRV